MFHKLIHRIQVSNTLALTIHQTSKDETLRATYNFRLIENDSDVKLFLAVDEITFHSCYVYGLSCDVKSVVRALAKLRPLFNYLHFDELNWYRSIDADSAVLHKANLKTKG